MPEKIRVLVVDDLALRRDMLKLILESDPSIEVIGLARDGKEGVEKALALKPDVITMDIQMPVMNGIEATEKIMEEVPTPIIIVSGVDIQTITNALAIGAMDFVLVTQKIEEIARDLIEKVKIAPRVRPIRRMKIRRISDVPVETPKKESGLKVVAIGASTGGPQALHTVLSSLPSNFPAGILVVQHMTSGFTGGLVDWLRTSSRLDMRVAGGGDILKNAAVLFAPDEHHLEIDTDARIRLRGDKAKTMFHIPSIDVMMKSVAASYGKNAIGVLMTGMGRDGAQGMDAIKRSGGVTIAQDEETSAIFGMNKAAIDTGCVDKVVPLDKIADEIIKSL